MSLFFVLFLYLWDRLWYGREDVPWTWQQPSCLTLQWVWMRGINQHKLSFFINSFPGWAEKDLGFTVWHWLGWNSSYIWLLEAPESWTQQSVSRTVPNFLPLLLCICTFCCQLSEFCLFFYQVGNVCRFLDVHGQDKSHWKCPNDRFLSPVMIPL